MIQGGWRCRVVAIWMTLMVTMMVLNVTSGAKKDKAKQGGIPPKPKKPHIILMVADDLGWNDVSWNNKHVITPNLGNLALNGVILNYSYVLPTCTPTRAALLTGIYPFTIGMQKGALEPMEAWGLPLQYRLLPRDLKKLGYSTHAIGKWHLGFCSDEYVPTRRGFDTFYGYYTGSVDYYSRKRTVKKIRRRSDTKRTKRKEYLDLRNNTKPDYSKGGIYSTYLFASAAEEVIRSRDPAKPMFLYLPFQSVHAPLQVPKNYTRVYSKIGDYFRRNYLGMVMAMDDLVGRVVQALKDTGHYENSVIIFTTDNGGSIKMGASNYPLRGGKSNLLEGGTRGPTFISAPFLLNKGTVSNQLFHVTDWYNTILKMAGGQTRKSLDSIDQWDAINGDASVPRQRFVYNIVKSEEKFSAAIRFNEFKLAIGSIGTKKWAPYHPIRLRRGKEIVLYDDTINNASTLPLQSTQPQPHAYSLRLFLEESSNYTIFSNNDSSLEDESDDAEYSSVSPSEEQVSSSFSLNNTFSLEDEETTQHGLENNQFSPRLLDPYIAVYGRKQKGKNNKTVKKKQNNDKKTTKVKKNSATKRPTKNKKKPLKNKNENKNKNKNKSKKNKCRGRKNSKCKRKKKKHPYKEKNPLNNKKPDNWNEQSKHIRWWRFKYDNSIGWNKYILKKLNNFVDDNEKIRLFNITADPGETTDLSRKYPEIIRETMTYLAVQLYSYKRPKRKRMTSKGHPMYHNEVWSPGWCNAERE